MKVARELVQYDCDGVELKGYSAFVDDHPQHQKVRAVLHSGVDAGSASRIAMSVCHMLA